ncbi:MAG: cob(I)yrinic acid a,c-diamide adenosyltransferase [Actinobacteria bacterium]|nr:MAG: cob(I)yrinic acid a,c-diamide adenosyltransferase [Actinomycetota bacterium]
MTIYTRRGDEGTTSLADGSRAGKSGARVEAYGSVDEANSAIGFARAAVGDVLLGEVLGFVQHKLFNCSASLATPAASRTERTPVITAADVEALERAVDRFETHTGALTAFVLEGGGESGARLHMARAVVRRAERRVVALAGAEEVDPTVLAFLNRSSDVLFAAARYANALDDVADESWDPTAEPPTLGA